MSKKMITTNPKALGEIDQVLMTLNLGTIPILEEENIDEVSVRLFLVLLREKEYFNKFYNNIFSTKGVDYYEEKPMTKTRQMEMIEDIKSFFLSSGAIVYKSLITLKRENNRQVSSAVDMMREVAKSLQETEQD